MMVDDFEGLNSSRDPRLRERYFQRYIAGAEERGTRSELAFGIISIKHFPRSCRNASLTNRALRHRSLK